MTKFKVGDKARVRRDLKIGWSYGEWCFNDKMKAFKGGELTIKRVHSDMYEVEENIWKWTDEMLEEVNEELTKEETDLAKEIVDKCLKEKELREKNKMGKTFREVIADIKEGEVWENYSKKIKCHFDGIQIYHKDEARHTPSMLMLDRDKFTLQRKEYTFEEAFKALEEGKEIESCATKTRFKVIDEELKVLNPNTPNLMFYYFSYKEIKNKWYIN